MLNENAKKWITALRSKKYKKGTGGLKGRDFKDRLVYCCLGVACDLYHKETGLGEWQPRDNDCSFYLFFSEREDISGVRLTEKVRKWLELSDGFGFFKDQEGNVTSLSALNDKNSTTFEMIAKKIEEEPKGLFLNNKSKNVLRKNKKYESRIAK